MNFKSAISNVGSSIGKDWAPQSLATVIADQKSAYFLVRQGVARIEMVRLAVWTFHDGILHAVRAVYESLIGVTHLRIHYGLRTDLQPRVHFAKAGDEGIHAIKCAVATVFAPLAGAIIEPEQALKFHAWMRLPGPEGDPLRMRELFLIVGEAIAAASFAGGYFSSLYVGTRIITSSGSPGARMSYIASNS